VPAGAGWCWLVLAAWVVLVAGGAVASGPVFAGLESSRASDRLESVRAFDVIGNNATYGSRVLGLVEDVPIADPAVKARIEAAAADVARVPHVGRVVDPYKGARAGLIATDGRGGVVVVDLDRTISGTERDAAIDAASARLRQLDREIPGATVKIGGTPLLNQEINARIGMSEPAMPVRPRRRHRHGAEGADSEPRVVQEDGRTEVRPAAPTPD